MDTTYIEKLDDERHNQVIVHVIGSCNELRHIDCKNIIETDIVFNKVIAKGVSFGKIVNVFDEDNVSILDFNFLPFMKELEATEVKLRSKAVGRRSKRWLQKIVY